MAERKQPIEDRLVAIDLPRPGRTAAVARLCTSGSKGFRRAAIQSALEGTQR